jgi:carbonic anhydrase
VWAVSPDKFHWYSDVNQATQKQVLKLRSHPWIPSEVTIRGFVFDLATGELREVTPKDEHAAQTVEDLGKLKQAV